MLNSSRRLILSLTLFAAVAALSGCGNNFGFPGVYKINVEQGNIVNQEMVDQLKLGMTRRQVNFVMGTPLVKDSFNASRWDYRYTLRNGNDTLSEEHVYVFFEEDKLVKVEGTLLPAWAKDGATEQEATDIDEQEE